MFRGRREEDKEVDPGMEEQEPMVVLQAAPEVEEQDMPLVETEREEVWLELGLEGPKEVQEAAAVKAETGVMEEYEVVEDVEGKVEKEENKKAEERRVLMVKEDMQEEEVA